MPKLVSRRNGALILTVLALATPGWAQSSQLESVEKLFAAQDYAAAHEAALKVDASKLTDAEKARFDELQKVLPEAVAKSEKATADLAAAQSAQKTGDAKKAAEFYRAVRQNFYATTSQIEQAHAQLTLIAEQERAAEKSNEDVTLGTPGQTKKDGSVTVTDLPPGSSGSNPSAQSTGGAVNVGVGTSNGKSTPGGVSSDAGAPMADNEAARLTPTDQLNQRDELEWQRAVAKAQELANAARDAIGKNEYNEARQFADEALQKIEAARGFASPVSKYTAAREQMLGLKVEVQKASDDYEIKNAADERAEIARRTIEREELIKQQRQEKIEQLFNTAAQLRQEQRFAEATEVLRQILYIDPANAKASYQLEMALDYASFAMQGAANSDMERQTVNALTKAEEALIPWDYEVLYPKNWLELTAKRSTAGIGPGGATGADSEIMRKLGEPLGEIRFDSQPFASVIDFLQDLTKVNMVVDWDNLTENGISRDKEVSLNVKGLSFRTVLTELLSQVGGDTRLAYEVGDNLLRIATKDKLDKNKQVLVYDIRDLLINVPRFSAQSGLNATQVAQGGQGGGGGNIFQGGNNDDDNLDDENQDQGAGIVGQILDIIRQTVEPDSWRETGGGDASLRELNGQMIVFNTSDAQRQIVDLLTQLRATKSLQIAVEARFLNVESNFLEQFGVDLDFVFNSGNAGWDPAYNTNGRPLIDPSTGAAVLIPRQTSRIGALPAAPPSPPFGAPLVPTLVAQPYGQPGFVPPPNNVLPPIDNFTPIGAQQNSLTLTNPGQINTNVPGSWAQRAALAPALSIAGSFLDGLQVDFLIRATQANRRSSIVQAPRIVLFNGQRSRVQVGRSRSYVASVNPQLAEGAVGVQPVIQVASSGTELIVDGTISADRKYVTLTVITSQADEPRFERFEVQRASGSSPGIFVMLPDQTFATVRTTVSVPDGGTVLIGGLKQVGEEELEAGVPVLSKIPVLKRAFSNTTTVKDTRTLLILLKSKIIIQKEAEEEAFPTMASNSAGG